jgi:hypothetical protein
MATKVEKLVSHLLKLKGIPKGHRGKKSVYTERLVKSVLFVYPQATTKQVMMALVKHFDYEPRIQEIKSRPADSFPDYRWR